MLQFRGRLAGDPSAIEQKVDLANLACKRCKCRGLTSAQTLDQHCTRMACADSCALGADLGRPLACAVVTASVELSLETETL